PHRVTVSPARFSLIFPHNCERISGLPPVVVGDAR
ncbi:MAG: hypothetical protein ACI9R7_001898, partial [Lysobacterales bacterium]